MTEISPMAFYCCGIRAEDARNAKSICGDTYAERFMTDEGWRILSGFGGFGNGQTKKANLLRHKMITELLSGHLDRSPQVQIVNVGAGFDTRPFRMCGGKWFEFDTPALIAHKNTCLPPEEAPNKLIRVGVDFEQQKLSAALEICDAELPTVVVVEGVLMYLDKVAVKTLLTQLQTALPHHTLICELIDAPFLRIHLHRSTREQLLALGTPFKLYERRAKNLVCSYGYTMAAPALSVPARMPWPVGYLSRFDPTLRGESGYRVYTFRYG